MFKQMGNSAVDGVCFAAGIYKDLVSPGLVVGNVGHVDVHSPPGDARGDAVGVKRLERNRWVSHEERAAGHGRVDIRVRMRLQRKALLGLPQEPGRFGRVGRQTNVGAELGANLGRLLVKHLPALDPAHQIAETSYKKRRVRR